jgi:hypothetical protein
VVLVWLLSPIEWQLTCLPLVFDVFAHFLFAAYESQFPVFPLLAEDDICGLHADLEGNPTCLVVEIHQEAQFQRAEAIEPWE